MMKLSLSRLWSVQAVITIPHETLSWHLFWAYLVFSSIGIAIVVAGFAALNATGGRGGCGLLIFGIVVCIVIAWVAYKMFS